MSYRSLTYDQYAALGMSGPWTAPFALENRGPRDQGGSGKYYASRGHKILGICLHITAGITGIVGRDRSAEATTEYGRTTTRDASWTTISDSDSCINSLHPDRVAWVQGVPGFNFNRPLWGHEIGKADADWGKMSQTWIDATLRNVAVMLAPVVIRYDIPLRLVTDRDEVQRLINAGRPVGFTYHWRLTPGTRNDPGLHGGRETFPIERLFHFLRIEIARLTGTKAPVTPEPTPTSVKAGTVLEVTAVRLNTRSGPGTTHGVVGGADRGVRVTATGKTSGAWIEASTPYQATRKVATWWHSGYLRVVSQPKPAPKPSKFLVRVTARDGLNVRSGPGTNYRIVTGVKHGEIYTITETRGDWGKLLSGAGWIYLDHTARVTTSTPKPTPPTAPSWRRVTATAGLNVRTGPGTNYRIVATAKHGDRFRVSLVNGKPVIKDGWTKGRTDAMRDAGAPSGWVSSRYIGPWT